jgi:hypothetical protein
MFAKAGSTSAYYLLITVGRRTEPCLAELFPTLRPPSVRLEWQRNARGHTIKSFIASSSGSIKGEGRWLAAQIQYTLTLRRYTHVRSTSGSSGSYGEETPGPTRRNPDAATNIFGTERGAARRPQPDGPSLLSTGPIVQNPLVAHAQGTASDHIASAPNARITGISARPSFRGCRGS